MVKTAKSLYEFQWQLEIFGVSAGHKEYTQLGWCILMTHQIYQTTIVIMKFTDFWVFYRLINIFTTNISIQHDEYTHVLITCFAYNLSLTLFQKTYFNSRLPKCSSYVGGFNYVYSKGHSTAILFICLVLVNGKDTR